MGDDEWPQQKAQRDVMLADFDFHNGFGDRSARFQVFMLLARTLLSLCNTAFHSSQHSCQTVEDVFLVCRSARPD